MLNYTPLSLYLVDVYLLFYLSLGLLVGYYAVRSVYRLYFHPLSHIPGPKLTVVTSAYECYYDVFKGGKFIWQIAKMHEKYGPIVRINAREVHIKDSSYFDEIYAGGTRKRDKDAAWLAGYSVPTSMVSTVGHDHHRYRRNILGPYFSKRSVNDLSPVIEKNVQRLMTRFTRAYHEKTVLHLGDAFAALASDVISEYAYGKTWGFLEDEHFRGEVRAAIVETAYGVHVKRFFPTYGWLLRQIPPWIVCRIQPGKTAMLLLVKSIFEFTQQQIRAREMGEKTGRTTIHEKLTDPALPPEERTFARVHEETIVLLQAGTESIGRALNICAFHLAYNPDMWNKLREELLSVLPSPDSTATWSQLEQLPYLTGVLMESLRLNYGLVLRLPRCAPNESLRYGDYVLPPGTPVSQSHYFVHHDEDIFPDSFAFKPERWIGDRENWDRLHRHMVSFNKGSRQCLGYNFSYSVLYKAIAYFVRRYDMELYDTVPKDLEMIGEYGLAWTRNGEVEVAVKVTKVVEE